MSHSLSTHRAGRPKDPAKRAAIVTTAIGLFTRQPYETVTMEAVAAQAGVSKMTIYSHFTDKETLFETVVSAISDKMMSAISMPIQSAAPLHARLTATGTDFLTVILDPLVRAMAHTLPAALHANQALAQRFYNAGPGRVRTALAATIADAAEHGTLVVDSPKMAADDLISLWESGLPAQLAFGLIAPVTPREIKQRAHRGTQVFLRAYAAPPRS